MKTFKNLVLIPSKSGKMTKKHMECWYDNCFKPLEEQNKVLLLIDSWGGQKNKEFVGDLEEDWLDVEIIPSGTTGMIQPCDVYFFRPYKILARKLVDEIRTRGILNPEEKYPAPHEREFVARMHSLILQKFKAKCYKQMIKGAFKLAGYSLPVSNKKERFKSTTKLQFKLEKSTCELCQNDIPFIRC